MDALALSLARSPELFPHALDIRADSVTFAWVLEAEYRAASFLDERILSAQMPRRMLGWPDVRHALDQTAIEERCAFIFHIGHVGSTLLSRLLGEAAGVFALREPAILRSMAQIRGEPAFEHKIWGADGFEWRLSALLKLWSRTFRPEDQPVVKATSFVSELAAELVSRPYKPRAILMYVSPESYLATILGGANAPQEARILAPERLKRLQRRLVSKISDLAALNLGEVVAMGWACEMTALVAARHAAGSNSLSLDFNSFLADPHSALSRVFHHLAVPLHSPDIDSILSGPEMRRYSKAPEYAYDVQLRREVLNHARATSGAAIRQGLAWLDKLSRAHPQVAAARDMAG
jgi:hypothetical protein